jgi:IS5 family transposase
MQKNYLKGFIGDQINLLLAATAFNLKKWMRIYFFALFLRDVLLLSIALKEINKLEQIQKKIIFNFLENFSKLK